MEKLIKLFQKKWVWVGISLIALVASGIYVRSLRQSQKFKLPSSIPLPSDCLGVDLSLNNKWIACSGTLDEQVGIWIQDIEGKKIIPVALHPKVKLDKSPRFEIEENGLTSYENPSWAPDSQKLAFISYVGLPPGSDYKLWVFDMKKQTTKVLFETEGFIDAVKWSPDGKSIAITELINERGRLLEVSLEETHKVLIEKDVSTFPQSRNALAWSPDGKSLLYQGGLKLGVLPVKIINLLTGEDKILWPTSQEGIGFTPAWRSDSKRIAILIGRPWLDYVSFKSPEYDVRVVFVNPDGSNAIEKRLNFPTITYPLLWSPNDKQLATISNDDIWLISVEDGKLHQLTQTGDIQNLFKWIRDGKELVVSTMEEIKIIPVQE